MRLHLSLTRLLLAMAVLAANLLGSTGAALAQEVLASDADGADALSAANPNFSIVEIDFPNRDVGQWPAIAIDPTTNQPVVVFRDNTRGIAMLAKRTTGTNGNCGPNNTWSCMDWTGYNVEMNDIAIAANGTVVTSHSLVGDSRQVVRNAFVGNTSEQVVNSFATQLRFSSSDFAADGKPRLAFHVTQILGEAADYRRAHRLVYAALDNNGVWQMTTLDEGEQEELDQVTSNGYFPSIDIGANNRTNIAYRAQSTAGGATQLKLAVNIGGAIKCDTADNGITLGDHEFGAGWHCYIVDPANGAGSFTTMHTPDCTNCGDGQRIAYFNGATGAVRFARYSGNAGDNCGVGGAGGWLCGTIDNVGTTAGGASMAHWNSTPTVAYQDKNDSNHGVVKLARYMGPESLFANCGSGSEQGRWNCEVVDDGGAAGDDVGKNVSVVRDGNGRHFLAYYNATKGSLRIAIERLPAKPTVSVAYSSDILYVDQKINAIYTLTNPLSEVMTGVGFSQQHAVTYQYMPGVAYTGCTGSIAVATGITTKITFSNGVLQPNSSCSFTVQIKGVTPGSYHYLTSVLANNEGTAGDEAGASLTVKMQEGQTIAVAPLADRAYGSAPFSPVFSASSGQPVVLISNTSEVCTVSGSTVTPVGVGACTLRFITAYTPQYVTVIEERTFQVTKAAQSITFAALPNRSVTDAPFALSASAGSGLAVSFASLTGTVCTVGNKTVTLVAAGTCTIKAQQPGNNLWLAAAEVSHSFSVSGPAVQPKQAQSITFADLPDRSVDDSPFSLSASASSGLAVSFSSLTGAVCTVSNDAVTLEAAGTCTIKAQQPGNNLWLAAVEVSRSFTVSDPAAQSKQAQSITFAAPGDHLLGDAPFPVTLSANSGLAVTLVSETPTVCGISGATVTVLGTGVCTLTATQAGSVQFYPAAPVTRSFAISDPAVLSMRLYLSMVRNG